MLLRTVKDKLSEFVDKNEFGDALYYRAKYCLGSVLGKLWGDERYAKWFYHLYTGRELNLDNPQRYDEKVWWLKLHNKDSLLTKCSDKNAVRDYVIENGYGDTLMPQLGLFDSVSQLDFSIFDCEVVAKCNHTSGGHIFYDPAKPLSAKELKYAKRRMNFLMHHNQYVLSREWNYKDIVPKIVVEKVVRDKAGKLPLDYKFMCFAGEPKLLFLDLGVMNQDDSYNHGYPRNIYDMDFNLLPVYETRPNADYAVEKPDNFEYMVEIARNLSKPFPHCRVDLYNVDGKVYFGEITFYHGGGCNNIKPEEWDYRMGSWIDIGNI